MSSETAVEFLIRKERVPTERYDILRVSDVVKRRNRLMSSLLKCKKKVSSSFNPMFEVFANFEPLLDSG